MEAIVVAKRWKIYAIFHGITFQKTTLYSHRHERPKCHDNDYFGSLNVGFADPSGRGV